MRSVVFGILVVVYLLGFTVLASCTDRRSGLQAANSSSSPPEIAPTSNEVLVYLKVVSAEASSFDQTPDWAPEPNPMATVDGDMLTRWSSDYENESHWIYFDLGAESTVSNVIIRWERAYATDYKILISSDAKDWKEVYHETRGVGGTMEANFTPIKCRYIKILSLAKVNEDWGISIWEVEIFGPKSQNPQGIITKETYLSKTIDAEKKREAEEKIESLSSPIIPISKKPFQKGAILTSWMADELSFPASDLTLCYLKEIGFDTVAIMVPAYQEDINSEKIFTNDKEGGDTPTMEALKHAIDTCHRLGMRVMLKPHVDPRTNEARINIMPSEKWFDSYEEFMLKYAKFAQENKVELFSIGTELEATTFDKWMHRWDQVIQKVREIYKGPLTYAANWTEYKEVPFWDKMDFIGIDAYFPLTETNEPSLEDLIVAWGNQASDIEKWLNEKNLTSKGIVFSEVGYPSSDAANRQPWVAITSVEDQKEQADCYQAMFEVMMKRPYFRGYYLWQYFPQERWSPLGFTVKGKKAEEVIKEWVKK